MNITIKNLKYSEFASHETFCFEATVYVDGKRSFIASNDGQGGCNNYYPVKGGDIPDNAVEYERTIFDLIADALTAKDLKKALKKITVLTTDGRIATYPAKYKPTDQNIKQVASFTTVQKVLNDLSFNEALEIFKKAA